MKSKHIPAICIVLVWLATSAFAQLATCNVTATLYDNAGAPRSGVSIILVRVVKSGVTISNSPVTYVTTSNGTVVIPMVRSSTTWVYADAYGLNANSTRGVPLLIPNTATAQLENLALLTSVFTTAGDTVYGGTAGVPTRLPIGANGLCYISNGTIPSWGSCASGAGIGTVTSVSVTTANGVSGSIATATTTPAITLTLGAITPTTVNGNTFTTGTYTLTGAAGKTLTFSNTLTFAGTDGSTLNVGAGGTLGTAAFTAASAYEVPLTFSTGLTRSTNTITVNTSQNIATLSNLTSNGIVTTSGSAGTLGVTVPGTGVLTALAVNVGSAGAFVTFNGAGGTPSSLTLTNATGLPVGGITGLGTGVATFLATPSSANLISAVTDETGSNKLVFSDNATMVAPTLGVASSTSESVTGTGGAGFIQLANQSSNPGTPTTSGRIFFDSSNHFSWIGTNGLVRTFDGTANTADRMYVLPDAAGTIALTANKLSAFAATTSAELAGVLSDETGGSGLAVFNSTPTIITPSFTTGFTIGGTAATGTIPRGNGTNFVASAFTMAAPGTSGNVLTSDGTNWLSSTPAASGANTALSNLASVSINASLIPQTTLDLGAAATAWRNLYIYGGGTFGSHSIKFSGTPTGNRTITFPDATDTVALLGTAQTFTAAQSTAATARTSGNPTYYFRTITPADTGLTASTESMGNQFGGDTSAATVTRQFATGALATQRENVFVAPTYGFVGASTLTNASTVAITGAPTAGTNATITNKWGLLISPGPVTGVPLRINSQTSQTGNLIEVADTDAATIRFRLDSSGRIGSRGVFIGAEAITGTLAYDELVVGAVSNASAASVAYGSAGPRMGSAAVVSWSSGTNGYTTGADVSLVRHAAGGLRITNASTGAGSLLIGTSAGAIGTSGAGVLAFTLSTAPSTSPTDTVQLYSGDAAAADHNAYWRNEAGEVTRATGLAARNSAQFDATSTTTLATVTGLTRNVEASRTYAFTAVIQTTAAATGGVKLAVSGTATATAISYEGILAGGAAVIAQTRSTAMDGVVCASTTATAGTCTIRGVIQVNAAGTLLIQFAQNNSDGTASSVLANQFLQLIPIN